MEGNHKSFNSSVPGRFQGITYEDHSLAAAQRANIDFFSLRSKSADSSPTWGRNKEKKKELVLKLFQRPSQCPKHVPPHVGDMIKDPGNVLTVF